MTKLTLSVCALAVALAMAPGVVRADEEPPPGQPLPPPPGQPLPPPDQPLPPPSTPPPPPPPPWGDAPAPGDPFGAPPPVVPEGPLPEPCEAPDSVPAMPQPPIREVRIVQVPSGRTPCAQRRDSCGWPLDVRGCRYGRSEVTVEALYGFANSPEGRLGLPAYGAGPELWWNGLDYDGAFGGRVTWKTFVCPQNAIEVRGTYFGRYEGDTEATGVFGFSPGTGAASDVAGPLNTTFASKADAWAAEANYVAEVACAHCLRWDLLGGVHYVQFNEESTAAFGGPSFVTGDVENLFVGLQVGATAHWDLQPCLEVLGTLKVMGGYLRRDAAVTDQSVFVGGSHRATSLDEQVAFGAEVELGVRWRLHPRLAVTAGYDLLFVDDILRGYDALDFSQSQSGAVQVVQATDQLLIHTFFLGLDLNF